MAMLSQLTKLAGLILLALVSHACATLEPYETMPARSSLTAIDDHSLPALTSFNELIATIPGEFQVFRWDQSPSPFKVIKNLLYQWFGQF